MILPRGRVPYKKARAVTHGWTILQSGDGLDRKNPQNKIRIGFYFKLLKLVF